TPNFPTPQTGVTSEITVSGVCQTRVRVPSYASETSIEWHLKTLEEEELSVSRTRICGNDSETQCMKLIHVLSILKEREDPWKAKTGLMINPQPIDQSDTNSFTLAGSKVLAT